MKHEKNIEAENVWDSFFSAPIPSLPMGYPNGWMSAKDLTILYNAASMANGDVLEVGPWLGRSSSAIAAGLQAREAAGSAALKYDIIDFGITSAQEWQDRFNHPLRFDKDQGRVAEAVLHPGGTIAVLIQNLKANGLLKSVTNIIRGDFLECPISRSYGMIFCDATHDVAEIDRHLPKIAELAAPGATLVFDDIVTEEAADHVCSYLKVENRFLTRHVFPNRSQRCKLMVVKLKGTPAKPQKA